MTRIPPQDGVVKGSRQSGTLCNRGPKRGHRGVDNSRTVSRMVPITFFTPVYGEMSLEG